ncbi:MAG: cupin domain-containing protein [Rhizobacter sp.]|nr:cupin domain-containing protein [Rhizobacter sp.]
MTRPSDPVPPAQARQIKARLLERVADADLTHLTVDAHQGSWQAFAPGIALKVLREHEGVLSYLLKLDPGATLPAHRHPLDEECLVLEGRLRVGTRIEIGPGGYHVAHRGALHATIGSTTGATIFLRGAIPELGQALASL